MQQKGTFTAAPRPSGREEADRERRGSGDGGGEQRQVPSEEGPRLEEPAGPPHEPLPTAGHRARPGTLRRLPARPRRGGSRRRGPGRAKRGPARRATAPHREGDPARRPPNPSAPAPPLTHTHPTRSRLPGTGNGDRRRCALNSTAPAPPPLRRGGQSAGKERAGRRVGAWLTARRGGAVLPRGGARGRAWVCRA